MSKGRCFGQRRVRITAKLIREPRAQSCGRRAYERDLQDVVALHREVARTITSKVDITLTPQAAGATSLVHGRSIRRFIGKCCWVVTTPPKPQRKDYERRFSISTPRIAKDPANALAYAGLAEAYTGLSGFYLDPREAMPKAKRAAETALRLDESLADAHAALGYVHLVCDWDGPAAEKALLRALALNPTLATARLNYAAYLTTQARHDQAVQEIRRAINLDPLSIRTHAIGTVLLLFTRHYDEAIELARKGLEFEPDSGVHPGLSGCRVCGARSFRRSPRQPGESSADWTTA